MASKVDIDVSRNRQASNAPLTYNCPRPIGVRQITGTARAFVRVLSYVTLSMAVDALVISGRPVTGPAPDTIGVMFQDAWLLPWKTAVENVEFPLALRKVPAAVRRTRALPLIDLVGLTSFAHRYPDELSGGMRQRVAIARCLVQEPRVLLMDEPFAALDEQTRTRMGSELLQIWEKSGGTVVFVTHGLTEAIYLADTVFVMGTRPGRIIERITVPLPRPRTIDMIGSEAFGRLRNHIWHLIAEVRT